MYFAPKARNLPGQAEGLGILQKSIRGLKARHIN
jgi:hypothetical protein